MAWVKWDSLRVAATEAHNAINLFRQVDNARDNSESRMRAYAIYFDPRDPMHVGSIGKHRNYFFRCPVSPECGSLRIVYSLEVLDASVNLLERVMGRDFSTTYNRADLAVTNGITTLEHTVDITDWQADGWSPEGVPIGIGIKSLASAVQNDWDFIPDASAVDFLATGGNPLATLINPLKCMSVEFRNSGTKQSTGALPTNQTIETIALGGDSAWAATVAVGGVGYVVGDVLTLVVAGTTTAAVRVDALTGTAVKSVTVITPGTYAAQPVNPVGTAGGSGVNCTLTMTWNDGGFRIWPPLATMDSAYFGAIPSDTVRTIDYGRIKIYSISIEEIEQTPPYVTQNAPDLFPIESSYEVKKTLQSGYALRDQQHRAVYQAGENLFAYRTAVHSCGGRSPGGTRPGDLQHTAKVPVYHTTLWSPSSADDKHLFGVWFDEGDRFYHSTGVDYVRRAATIYADVLFFAREQTEFTAGFFAEFTDPTATTSPSETVIYTTDTELIDISPITAADPRGSFADYEEHIYNYYRTIDQDPTAGARNNLQGLHEIDWVTQWDNLSAGLVKVRIEAFIPDITKGLTTYLRVKCDIDGDDVPGIVKAMVLGWHVIEKTGMQLDALGRP